MAARKYGAVTRQLSSSTIKSRILTHSTFPFDLDRLTLDQSSGGRNSKVAGESTSDEKEGYCDLGKHVDYKCLIT